MFFFFLFEGTSARSREGFPDPKMDKSEKVGTLILTSLLPVLAGFKGKPIGKPKPFLGVPRKRTPSFGEHLVSDCRVQAQLSELLAAIGVDCRARAINALWDFLLRSRAGLRDHSGFIPTAVMQEISPFIWGEPFWLYHRSCHVPQPCSPVPWSISTCFA